MAAAEIKNSALHLFKVLCFFSQTCDPSYVEIMEHLLVNVSTKTKAVAHSGQRGQQQLGKNCRRGTDVQGQHTVTCDVFACPCNREYACKLFF